MAIVSVWVEEGCILCGSCERECPDVFKLAEASSVIQASVRWDGLQDENRRSRSPLRAEPRASLEAGIRSAATLCPVEVIKFE